MRAVTQYKGRAQEITENILIIEKSPYLYEYNKLFFVFVFLSSITTCITFIEPSPYDYLTITLSMISIPFLFSDVIPKLKRPILLLWIFVICNIFSLYFAINFAAGIRYLLITIYLLITWWFFASLILRFGLSTAHLIFHGYVVGATITCIIGIISYFTGILSYRYMHGIRLRGLFKNPNGLAGFLLTPLFYCLYKVLSTEKRVRIFWLLLLGINLAGLLLTYSRGGLVNLLFATFIFVFLYIFKSSRTKGAIRSLAILVLLLCFFIFFFYYFIKIPEVSKVLILRREEPVFGDIRFTIQKQVLRNVLNKPFGVGPGQIVEYTKWSTHNLYLLVLFENGFLAFFAFFSFIIFSIARCFKAMLAESDNNRLFFVTVISILLGALAHSFFIDSLHWRHLWFLLAIPWGYFYDEKSWSCP